MIIESGPLAYETKIDVAAAVKVLVAHGLPAQASLHAGAFLCNQTFYLGCHDCQLGGISKAVFIHVPPMESYDVLVAGLHSLLIHLGCQ